MSRWSRRTDEEKKEIRDKQKRQEQEAAIRKKSLNNNWKQIGANLDRLVNDKEQWTKVINDGNIPILCMNDGWVGCKKYTLREKAIIKGMKPTLVVEGNCEICQRPITGDISAFDGNTMLVMLILERLKREGQLVDLREKEARK